MIYGAGSGFERTSFYRMFDGYGKRNLFTFHTVREHSERKKLVANAYSKSLMLKGPAAGVVKDKVSKYLALIKSHGDRRPAARDLQQSALRYFSLGVITHFLSGSAYGGTPAVAGDGRDRALLDDVVDPIRRYLSWFAVHLPTLTKWLYTRDGLTESILTPFLPMQKPTTYTGIRKHALESFQKAVEKAPYIASTERTIVARLWASYESVTSSSHNPLSSLDIASECANHLLAKSDTTSDSLMPLTLASSRPRNLHTQHKLAKEVCAVPKDLVENGTPSSMS